LEDGLLDWPIVVDPLLRQRLLDRLGEADAPAQLIRGPGGIGKSTLAESVATELAAQGFIVLRLIGLEELREVPLAAMAPALSRTGGQATGGVSERLQLLFDVVTAEPGRYLMLVDDGPLLDEISASTLYQLARSTGVRCLITARSDHEITGPLARMMDEGRVETTELAGLGASRSRELIERALGASVEPDSLQRLVETAGGNPLFLRELLIAAVDRDAISSGDRGLVVDDSPLPRRLMDNIASHFAPLSAKERRVAELIAVAGPWPQQMLGESRIVASLIARNLVRVVDGSVLSTHPLFSDVLIGQMNADDIDGRRVEAAGLFNTEFDEAVRFKVACLLAETSAPPDAHELAWAAGYAEALNDHALAARLAERSIAADATFAALYVRAVALSAMLRVDEADAAFALATDAATTDHEIALSVRGHGNHDAIRRQNRAAAIRRGVASLATLAEPSARSLLASDIGRWRLMSGDVSGQEVLAGATSHDSSAQLNMILYELMQSTRAGDIAGARSALERGRPLVGASRLALPQATSILDLFEFLALVFDRGLSDAAAFAQLRAIDTSNDAIGMWSYALALVDLHAGNVEEAFERAAFAVERLRWRDFTAILMPAITLQATTAAQLGRRQAAVDSLDQLPALEVPDTQAMLQRAEAEAWLLVWDDDTEGAVELVAKAALEAIETNAHALAALTIYLAVRLGEAPRVIDILRDIARVAQGPLVAAMLAHAESSAAKDKDGLLRAAAGLAAVGLRAGAVDAALQASRIMRAAGNGEGERKAGMLIASWNRGLSGYRQARHERSPFELTEREWAVATAAAGRERSKEIAGSLGVSTRTVDNHLASIYRKLGVAGRDELRAEIERLPR
jgi:DNA-binding CsgD family transcriptional regulator